MSSETNADWLTIENASLYADLSSILHSQIYSEREDKTSIIDTLVTSGRGSADYDSWEHDDLHWSESANFFGDYDNISKGTKLEEDTDTLVNGRYNIVSNDIKIEWSNQDQTSRFVESFKSTPKRHKKKPVTNPYYQFTKEEEKRLSNNCEAWLNKIKALGIEKTTDLDFVLRPDFPDVISQILGVAGKGCRPILNTEYEFQLRLPPSMVEKKILALTEQLKQPEMRMMYKNKMMTSVSSADDAIKSSTLDTLIELYRTYIPMQDEKNNGSGTLHYQVADGRTLKLEYNDFRTRENIIRKHVMKHFASNRYISVYLVKRMKTYKARIAFIRQFVDSVHQFDSIPSLKQIEAAEKEKDVVALYLKYRRNYLSAKTLSRFIKHDKSDISGTYTKYNRSTYYKYFTIFTAKELEGKKIAIITTDKTINDIVFRIFKIANCVTTIYGDFNYNRLGGEFTEYMIDTNQRKYCQMKKTFRSHPTSSINIDVPFEQYDYVIIDTVCLAVLRNSIVYGDFQEAHDYFNLVSDRLRMATKSNTQVVLRAGMANVCFTRSPLNYNAMKIEEIKFFKATGPEALIRFSCVKDGSEDGPNEQMIRRSILMKMLILEDLSRLKTSGLKYYVKPLGGFHEDPINIVESDMHLRLTGKKGTYIPYSKTRHTNRFSNGTGTDIVYNYLTDINLRTSLSTAAISRKVQKSKETLVEDPLSAFIASGSRYSQIIASLVRHDYNLNDVYLDLSIKGDYTFNEIHQAFSRCINVPIGDTTKIGDTKQDLINAIKYVVRYAPDTSTFDTKFKNLKDIRNIYFEEVNSKMRFKGLTDVCEDDIYEPLLIKAQSILERQKTETFQEYAINEQMCAVTPDYCPSTPQYNPRSPDYYEENIQGLQ